MGRKKGSKLSEETKRKMTNKVIYRRCPTAKCRTISGFCLTNTERKKDKKFNCPSCNKEYKLSKWKEVTIKSYQTQCEIRGNSNFYKTENKRF